MIERALIVEVIDTYHVRIRIPTFNKSSTANGATPDAELSIAPIATVPGCSPALKVGDMVIVGFEHDDTASPVVLGLFFNSNSVTTVSDIRVNSLAVDVDVKLPESTSIGNLTPNTIKYLEGLNKNVQIQFDEAHKEVQALRAELLQLKDKLNDERVRGCTQ